MNVILAFLLLYTANTVQYNPPPQKKKNHKRQFSQADTDVLAVLPDFSGAKVFWHIKAIANLAIGN